MTAAPVIALDGGGGVGKSTLGCRLAARFGFHLLVSGALYRMVGVRLQRAEIALTDAAAIEALVASLEVRCIATADAVEIECNGRRVTPEIAGETAAAAASVAARSPPVRAALLALQRACRRAPGLVADGRDMGTVVFPDAALKVFLTATPRERARRRYKQLREQGFDVTLDALAGELEERDRRDADRAIAPLRAADDAVVLDTTHQSVEETVLAIAALAAEKNIKAL